MTRIVDSYKILMSIFLIVSFKQCVLKIMANKINFISNNVKDFQSNNKRLKIIKYFNDKIVSYGFLFLQEKHLTLNDEIK